MRIKQRALVVGIQAKDVHGWGDWSQDARVIADRLKEVGFSVKTLLNEEATLAAIRASLEELVKPKTEESEVVLFYFSGYGLGVSIPEVMPPSPAEKSTDYSKLQGSLIPYDFQRDNYQTTCLSVNELYQILEKGAVNQKQVVCLDSDYSCKFIDLADQEKSKKPTKHARYIITAEDISYADSPLTKALLKVIEPSVRLISKDLEPKLTQILKQTGQKIKVEHFGDGDKIPLTIGVDFRGQSLWNDLASGKDLLDIKTEVEAIAEMLLMRDVEPPLTVGVLGGWGTGKSYIMHLMQKRMTEIRRQSLKQGKAWGDNDQASDKTLSPYVGHIYQIKFDAWTYARSNLWASLMDKIFVELNRQLTLEKQLEKVGIDPLEEGEIWQVLNEMSETEQNLLITQVLGNKKSKEFRVQLDKIRPGKLGVPELQLLRQVLDTEQIEEKVQKEVFKLDDEQFTKLEKWQKTAELKYKADTINTELTQLFRQILKILKEPKNQEIILKKIQEKQKKNWNKIKTNEELEDELLKALASSQKHERDLLFLRENQLKSEQEKLEKEKKKIAKKIHQEIQEEQSIKLVQDRLEKLTGSIFNTLIEQINSIIKDQGQQINAENIEWIKSKIQEFKTTQLVTQSSICQWVKSNQKGFVLFIIFFILTIITPLIIAKLTKLNQLTPELLAGFFAPLVPGIITAQKMLTNFRQWHTSIEKSFEEYKQKVSELYERQVKQELEKPEIKETEEKINYLKAKVNEQRQRVVATTNVAVTDFVKAQLEKGLYSQRLGLMNQVKNDLNELAEQLSLPPVTRKEKFKLKVQQLQQIFPRGPARIILFIDDLDRCPPKRVIEVLEAIQLIVNTPLFVVVVAIDERYITRTLEKVYEDILIPQGSPSGIDYVEKIIQIPYRCRTISSNAVSRYLEAQIQVKTSQITSQNTTETSPDKSDTPTDSSADNRSNSVTKNENSHPDQEENEAEFKILDFDKEELEMLTKCCQKTDLSARKIKRLVNVYKLFKLIDFRCQNPQLEEQQRRDAILSLLTLSGRYPNFVRTHIPHFMIKSP